MAVSGLSSPPVQPNPTTQSKSCTQFLCKSLIFALFLVVIPLFPSQAPDYINHTLITKFWELLHLLFIGIAVSYGVFSRRNVDRASEAHSTVDNLQSYVSRFFHVSSIFEDGFDNSSGSGGKSVIQAWNSQHFHGESMVVVTNRSSGFDKRGKPRSPDFENEDENPCGFDGKKMIQAWNSQYFRGETMVVVAKGSYPLDQWGITESTIGDKPLGLPVRSLRSRIKDSDSTESISDSRSNSSSKSGSSKSSGKIRNRKLGKVGPLNLEEKETAVLPSPIPWRSRSGRMEMREEEDSTPGYSHSVPLSVEEPQSEQLKSQSFRSSTSFSSQISSVSSSPRKLSPSSSSSPELRNWKVEEQAGKSSPATSPSPPEAMNGKAPLDASCSNRFCNESSSDQNVRRWIEKEPSRRRRDDQVSSKEWRLGSMEPGTNPGTPNKTLSRGRSVRTFRSSDHTSEPRKMAEMKAKVDDNPSHIAEPTFCKYHKKDMRESEELEEKGAENFDVSSDQEIASNIVSDGEPVPNEVDKKAGEFIAKFKEQIRLQKMASLRANDWETHL